VSSLIWGSWLSDSYRLIFVGRPLWREDGSAFLICCWSSPAQSFSGPNPLGLATIFSCLRFETSLSVASNDSQGHGGGIRPRPHTGRPGIIVIQPRGGPNRKHPLSTMLPLLRWVVVETCLPKCSLATAVHVTSHLRQFLCCCMRVYFGRYLTTAVSSAPQFLRWGSIPHYNCKCRCIELLRGPCTWRCVVCRSKRRFGRNLLPEFAEDGRSSFPPNLSNYPYRSVRRPHVISRKPQSSEPHMSYDGNMFWISMLCVLCLAMNWSLIQGQTRITNRVTIF
jgi:hypothetical protein